MRTTRRSQHLHQPAPAVDLEETAEEGCLSIPEFYEDVTRPAAVRVFPFRPRRQGAGTGGERAVGHLPAARDRSFNGVLFIDHISKLGRDRHQEIRQGGEARGGEGLAFDQRCHFGYDNCPRETGMADLLIRDKPHMERQLEARARAHRRSPSKRRKCCCSRGWPSRSRAQMGAALLNLFPAEYRGDDLVFEIRGETVSRRS